jgi:hypothetical protein
MLSSLSQQSDRRINKTNDNSNPTLWKHTYQTLQKDALYLHEPETLIPLRETSTSIYQSRLFDDCNQQNGNNTCTGQMSIHLSLVSPYLYRHCSMPPIFLGNTSDGSFFENIAGERGICTNLRNSINLCDEYQLGVQSPDFSHQHHPIYHTLQSRKESSCISPLSSDCILIYANGSEEEKEKTIPNTKFLERRTKTARKSKPKDRPKRPLSAYNLYFQQERQRILSEIPDVKASNELFRPKRRARPKIPHGKIGFESLAKEIGQRWQALNDEQINHYKSLATKEKIRYKEAMTIFREKNGINPKVSVAPRNVLSSKQNHVNESSIVMDDNNKMSM